MRRNSVMQHMGILWMVDLSDLATGPPEGIAPQVPALFEAAGPEQIDEIIAVMDYNGSTTEGTDTTEMLRQRFASGRSCYIARVEGQLASYGWVTFDEEKIGELGMSFRLLPGEAYIWDCATRKDFRGLRLYPALVTYIV